IRKDTELWKTIMLPRLKIFYFNFLLPELIDPRKKRGLTIRNAPRDTIRDYSELKSY
ncbi:hypothetical protein ILUMI_19521, partial [Ignelater luminosus]